MVVGRERGIPPPRPRQRQARTSVVKDPKIEMTTVAQELRALVQELEKACHRSPVNSVAWPAVSALCEYLALRAHVMEIDHALSQNIKGTISDLPSTPER